jgi:pimeloyl-ACP methyl ester carboxylesterase/predicted glycosyltransferase
MRAREPDHEGWVECDGVSIGYQVYGGDGPTVLLMPTWTVIHSRFWKLQVPYLSRHFRVVTYDGPGNGRSDRPLDSAAYAHSAQTGYARTVLDATGTDRAVVVGLSMAANWALELAAEHPDRVAGLVAIGPSIALPVDSDPRAVHSAPKAPLPDLPPSVVPAGGQDPLEHWAKFNLEYWRHQHEDFLWFFFGQAFREPHSTKPIEDAVGWGLETSGEVLVAHHRPAAYPVEAQVRSWCERVSAPVLVIHGDTDHVSPLGHGEQLAKLTGGELVVIEGGGHSPNARDPVRVNLLLEQFVSSVAPQRTPRRSWVRGRQRRRRVLYLSSPIGLGHAQRDLAVAQQLRTHHPDAEIDWLTQHPVTRVLEAAGERVHPASSWLVSESAHIESESAEHDLHAFQSIRTMDEILVANFMVFHDLIESEHYDLVVSDEGWDVDYFLHENPELKRFAYAWFTDFVGWLPMPDGGPREAYLTADYNAEMIEHIARFPRTRDRAIFVGSPEDVVPDTFGPDLPAIREWTRAHYDFAGYVTGFDPAAYADREALRQELGYRPDEQVCVVTVGGSGVGTHLLRRVIDAYPLAAQRVPGLRMVVVAGPRINVDALPSYDGLEVHAFVPRLYRHLAACDLAVVQGGLTTCMELTATGRPFIYVPLRHHFEQTFHVPHRLQRYGAGVQLDYADANPDHLADLIAVHIGRPTRYRPVETDGAARAARLLADLL